MIRVRAVRGLRRRRTAAVGAAAICLSGCGLLGGLFPGGGGSQFPRRTAWQAFTVSNSANVRPSVVALADFNGDGRLDVVTAYDGNMVQQPEVAIFFQVFASNAISWTPVTIGQAANLESIRGLAIADLNGDGRLDVIAGANGRIIYFRSPADPTQGISWQTFVIAQSEGAGQGQWNDVATGQIDNLNGIDIVAANAAPGRLSFFQAPAGAADGNGWVRFDIDAATRAGAVGVFVQDVNGDGRLDVISTAPDEANARIAWYRNPGGAATTAWTKIPIGNLRGATRLAVGDLDRDGRPDVVASNPLAETAMGAGDGIQIGWYQRPADPTTPWVGYVLAQYVSNTPMDVAITDVDVNGNPDVIGGTATNGTLRWFSRRNDIRATWIENNLADLAAGVNVQRIAVGDIDLDARPDVVAALRGATEAGDTVNWYLNPE